MARRAHRTRSAFSLLEATIALFILAVAAVVCLDIRAQGLVRSRALQELRSSEETIRSILELAEAGLLQGGDPPSADDPTHRRVWRGVEGGDAWQCVRERVEEPNPARAALPQSIAGQVPSTVRIERTTVTYRGRTAASIRAVRS